MGYLKSFTYTQLITTAKNFTSFCVAKLKIREKDISGSWLGTVINLVNGLSERLNDEKTKIEYLRKYNQNLEVSWALLKLNELRFIYENLIVKKLIDTKILGHKIKKIFLEPFPPTKESEKTNEPRNIFYELLLLGELLRSGINARVPSSGHPDIEVITPNRRIAIECKRIFKSETLLENFNDAKLQMERYSLPNQKYSYGIIAINVERVFNIFDDKESKLLLGKDRYEAEKKALDELEKLFTLNKQRLTSTRSTRIPALFLSMGTPIILENQKPHRAWGHFLLIAELADPSQISLYHQVEADFNRLQNPTLGVAHSSYPLQEVRT